MLKLFSKKLCPLLSLALATVSCGKKASQPQSSSAQNRSNQELPSAYIIRLDGSESSRKQIRLTGSANFEIPVSLKVRSGDTTGKSIEISYDVSEQSSDRYQFKCSYKPSTDPAELALSYCADQSNNDFGDVSGQLFTLYKDDIIQIKFTGARSSDLIVEAIYTMKWF